MKYPIYLPVCSSATRLLPTQWWTLYYHIVSKNKNDKCFVTKYTCANIIPYACKLILSINIKFLNMQPTTFSRLYNKMLPKLENNCRFRAGGIWLPIHSMAIRVVEFSNGGYKIKNIFAQQSTYCKCQNVPIFDFQSQFSMSKVILIFLIFFSLKNINLGSCFLLLTFFENFNF